MYLILIFFNRKSTVGAVLDPTTLTNDIFKGGWWSNRPYKYYL
jgi:hypothetical protein